LLLEIEETIDYVSYHIKMTKYYHCKVSNGRKQFDFSIGAKTVIPV
jgi:hypothetical protein